MKISIIIPVYNEQDYLAACLESLARQSSAPYEVIVIDNNSKDDTVIVAQHYPLAKIIKESRQGRVFAQEAGVLAAKGDIIARIDADTRLPEDWVEMVEDFFSLHPDIAAISGPPQFYDVRLPALFNYGQVLVYQYFQKLLTGTYMLWGANMAVRADAWRRVRDELSDRTDIDEDIDLSLCLHKNHLKIAYQPKLMAAASFQRGQTGPRQAAAYLATWPKDFMIHHMYLRSIFIRILIVVSLIIIAPLLLVAGSSPKKKRD